MNKKESSKRLNIDGLNIDEVKARMHGQRLYFCTDEALCAEQTNFLDMLYEFNQTRPTQLQLRKEMLKKMFAEVGTGCYIEPPFHANWGGKHVHFGNGVYANFNLTLVDDTHIYVGSNVMFAPNVTVITATHPIQPDLRRRQAQFNVPVVIENNVWIGANSVIMPGVTIGENSVIGAGSLVTKSIPANTVAFGSPCKVIREISQRDMDFYYKDMEIDIE